MLITDGIICFLDIVMNILLTLIDCAMRDLLVICGHKPGSNMFKKKDKLTSKMCSQ